MLFLLAGSAASGKTTALEGLRRSGAVDGLDARDSDEAGVPAGAGTAWRQQQLAEWVRYAVDRQGEGVDVLLAGQSPLGELLACPSVVLLEGVAAWLLDADDDVRLARLARRDGSRWSDAELEAFTGWASWHRDHARDPGARQEVVTAAGWPSMRWQRWTGWTADDPRWRVPVVDTTGLAPEAVAAQVAHEVLAARAAASAGRWPLGAAALSALDRS